MGRENESFRVPTQLVSNGYSIAVQALGDTGANGFIFIDTNLANILAKRFGLRTTRLPEECAVRGYNGHSEEPITHALIMSIVVDGRRQANLPMLIVNLGRHDLILGRMWFAHSGVLPDCKNRRLLWPEDLTTVDKAFSLVVKPLPRTILKREQAVEAKHQEDADRRDQQIAVINRKNKSRSPQQSRDRYRPRRTYRQDSRDAMAHMDCAFQGSPTASATSRKAIIYNDRELPKIDIAMIGAIAFHRHSLRKGTEIFTTSLYEIDRVIDWKKEAEFRQEEEELRQQVPECYHDYLDVFSKVASDTLPPQRPYDHKIELEMENTLGYSPLYKMSVEELDAAKKYIVENLHKGFIEPSSAPYNSPILMVRKPGGGLRFCVDYRKLNALTKKDRYPLPLIDEIMERLSRAKIFTKLDIRQGFHRIRMDPDSEDLTTFRTRYGAYKYKVMPFGLTNGPATFQRFINDVFMDYLDDFLTAFIDDLLIYSDNELDHQIHVRKVLERLREAGLQASISKCEFHVPKTKYLGFIVGTDGIEVDPEKVSAVAEWKRPTTVKGVQSFLGFCNFYRRFIRNYSKVARPLSQLTRKDIVFEWTPECEKAFQALKTALTSAPVLTHYRADLPTRVETDASDGVVAGVLSQQIGQEWHPVSFFSKTMAPPELNYEIHDKELLAVIRSLEEWRAELEGLQRDDRFDILTDHRALEYFMTTKKLNARQARWAEFLSRFYFLIRYRPGKENTLADTLTRQDDLMQSQTQARGKHRTQVLLKPEWLEERVLPAEPLAVEARSHSGSDLAPVVPLPPAQPITDRVRRENETAAELEEFREKARQDDNDDWQMEGGLLIYLGRLVVPDTDDLRARLLDEIHRQPSTAHPGRMKTRRLLRARYWWPGWSKDVDRYVDNCMTCKRTATWRDRTPGLLNPLPIPERPWQHISMDFRSFPKDRHGYDSVFVIVDRLSKRPISIPCHKTVTAKEMAQLYIDHVYRWTGPPDTIVSDRGGQFISEFWNEVCRILGIKLKLSTSHHPQTDGQTEIVNQYMAHRLRPFVNHYQDNWSELLPIVDFAAAVLPHESTGISPFLVNQGYEPRMSFDWTAASPPQGLKLEQQQAQEWVKHMEEIWEQARFGIEKAQRQQKTQADRHRREVDFDVGDSVMVTTKDWKLGRPSRKLGDQAAGPYPIVEKVGHAFKLDLPDKIRVSPTFNPEKLRRSASTEPLRGQLVDEQPSIQVDGQEEWEVAQVVAVRLYYGKLQYRVDWMGQDKDNTWYEAGCFKNAPHRIRDFHLQYPDRPGPPMRLHEWLRAAEDDIFLEDHIDDSRPVGWTPRPLRTRQRPNELSTS
jgi:transposase InsO family protein